MGEWRYSSTHFNLGTSRAEWSASRPDRFNPSERAAGTFGRLEEPRGAVGEIKLSCPRLKRNPDSLVVQFTVWSLYQLINPVSYLSALVGSKHDLWRLAVPLASRSMENGVRMSFTSSRSKTWSCQ
jgi:hypothetical protein